MTSATLKTRNGNLVISTSDYRVKSLCTDSDDASVLIVVARDASYARELTAKYATMGLSASTDLDMVIIQVAA